MDYYSWMHGLKIEAKNVERPAEQRFFPFQRRASVDNIFLKLILNSDQTKLFPGRSLKWLSLPSLSLPVKE